MSHAVVVVGPVTVRGPRPLDADLGSVAIDCIDDDLALIDDRVVPVDELWCDALAAAVGERCDAITLVCPSWWPAARVARVRAAADAASVTVWRRVDLQPAAVVVEIAAELIVVHADASRHAIARVGAPADVAEAVAARVAGLDAVTVDVPAGLALVGAEICRALRRRGIDVTTADDRTVSQAARARWAQTSAADPARWRRAITPRVAVLVGSVMSVSALAAAAFALDPAPRNAVAADGVTWLVEGRVAVEIPANWSVERITSGPGSARVEVLAPANHAMALHITQSRVPVDQTLAVTAEALRRALAEEVDGVFVDFSDDDRRADRPVVTYSEIRPGYRVDWAVMLDRGVRIAIGCQAGRGGAEFAAPCERAIRSARAVV